jgi:predicted phage-related endonuclease
MLLIWSLSDQHEGDVMIVDLTQLGLTAAQLAQRVHGIGGSDANVILSGKPDRILRLWEEKTGRAEPENLSGRLDVIMGSFTEALNVAWFTRQTGLIVAGRGEELVCQVDPWRTATLDGRIESDRSVFEAKHTNPFGKTTELIQQWMPQLHHNMDVAHVSRAHLSVFRGNSEWLTWEVDYDAEYGAALHKAEWEFWLSVEADEPPAPYPVPPPPAALATRTVDFAGDNVWADLAATWLETREAAQRHDKAKDGMKAKVEPDVARAHGHGVEINRDKRGSLRFSVMEG